MQDDEKKLRIVVYDPEILLWGIATSFHGYAIKFIEKYVDYVYINWKSRSGFRRLLSYKKRLKELGIKKHIRFTASIKKINKCTDVMFGCLIPECTTGDVVGKYEGMKVFHLLDYYLNTKKNVNFLKKNHVDYVMGHCQLDLHSPLFRKYYPEYIDKVIDVPFGYAERFVSKKSLDDRIWKAVGLGSINPMLDPMLSEEATEAIREFFPHTKYMHETRKYLQDHEEEFDDCIDALFPSPKKQKDFSYDAVSRLNDYVMFINDEGISNFPPARTYEGIACGCVMVAASKSIYEKLGFIPDVNYIAYEEKNYTDMVEKIRYYIENKELLKGMQEKSLELAKRYSHECVADEMYGQIRKRF